MEESRKLLKKWDRRRKITAVLGTLLLAGMFLPSNKNFWRYHGTV